MGDPTYVIGLDLGQSRDPTAIAVVRSLPRFGEASRDQFLEDGTEQYQCGHLQRLPLGTPYPAIIGHVAGLLDRLPGGTDPIGVLITGGTSESGDGRVYS